MKLQLVLYINGWHRTVDLPDWALMQIKKANDLQLKILLVKFAALTPFSPILTEFPYAIPWKTWLLFTF